MFIPNYLGIEFISISYLARICLVIQDLVDNLISSLESFLRGNMIIGKLEISEHRKYQIYCWYPYYHLRC